MVKLLVYSYKHQKAQVREVETKKRNERTVCPEIFSYIWSFSGPKSSMKTRIYKDWSEVF